MESTRTKVEVMKPIFLKAGIPLAISVVGFIFVKLSSTRKSPASKALNSENQVNSLVSNPREGVGDEESFRSFDSISPPSIEDEVHDILTSTHFTNPQTLLLIRDKSDAEDEVLGLRRRIEELQQREWILEARFFQYCEMKEQEKVFMEIESNLLLEMARVEFLGREICSLEADNRRFEDLVVEFCRLLKQLEFERLENGMLQKKVKKLSRKMKGMSCVIREQNTRIEEREAEGLRNREELERKVDEIKGMEGEIEGLQTVIDRLQEEKEELLRKLEVAENISASSKIEAEGIAADNYEHLVNELEKLQNDRAVEVKELIFLRWCNACLRHELMRRDHHHQDQQQERADHLELEFGGNGENGNLCFGNGLDDESAATGTNAHSKKPKLMGKIKRWVEGSEKMRQKLDGREKHRGKCLRSYLDSDGAEERQLPPRNSCSSA